MNRIVNRFYQRMKPWTNWRYELWREGYCRWGRGIQGIPRDPKDPHGSLWILRDPQGYSEGSLTERKRPFDRRWEDEKVWMKREGEERDRQYLRIWFASIIEWRTTGLTFNGKIWGNSITPFINFRFLEIIRLDKTITSSISLPFPICHCLCYILETFRSIMEIISWKLYSIPLGEMETSRVNRRAELPFSGGMITVGWEHWFWLKHCGWLCCP